MLEMLHEPLQETRFALLDHHQQTLVVTDVGGCARHEVHIAQHVHQQMPLDAVGRLAQTIAFVSLLAVSVFLAHIESR